MSVLLSLRTRLRPPRAASGWPLLTRARFTKAGPSRFGAGGPFSSPCIDEDALASRALKLGLALTREELSVLRRKADINGDGCASPRELHALVSQQSRLTEEKYALLETVVKADEAMLGQRMLVAADFLGTSLFAIVGTTLAGQAGMHVVGCTLVGCIAAMGGGTVNNLLTGGLRASPCHALCRSVLMY